MSPAKAQVAIGTSCDTTIASGGVAQTLCNGNMPNTGWLVANPNASDDLWCSDSTTPVANGAGSFRVVANGGLFQTPSNYRPLHVIACVGATTGDKITARIW